MNKPHKYTSPLVFWNQTALRVDYSRHNKHQRPITFRALSIPPRFVSVMCYNTVLYSRYGLDGSGIESRWGRNFPHPSRPALGPSSRVPGLSRG